jgi:N-acetyl-anhydromuramyl-L-alanine amidase AmpD
MGQERRTFLSLVGASLAGTTALGSVGSGRQPPEEIRRVPADESNYEDAARSARDIDWIVLHTTGSTYREAIDTFGNPDTDVSSHYVVGTEPGQITNTVRVEDIAWGAGNGPYNERGINIELEGARSDAFPDQLYENAAKLVEYLCETYEIPKRHPTVDVAPCDPTDGQGGILGHVQVPDPTDCSRGGGRNGRRDPGPNFEYERLFDAIRDSETGSSEPTFSVGADVVSTAAVNVRYNAEIAQNVEHTQPAGTEGSIIKGDVTNDGFRWWKIDWDNGLTGWSVQRYLETQEGNQQEEPSSGPTPRPISNTTDLRRRVDVTGRQLDEAIRRIRPDSPLIGLGDAWVATQEDLGIDAIYQAAHAIWESGWGTSDIAQDKRNLYGFDARDACPYECANGFDSFEESIQQVMEYVDRRYLSPDGKYHNGPHLKGMNVMYATDPKWDTGITDVYNRLVEHMPESREREQPERDPETSPDRSDRDRRDSGDSDTDPNSDGSLTPGGNEDVVSGDRPSESDAESEPGEESTGDVVSRRRMLYERYAHEDLDCRKRDCWDGFL